jgi:hypothetical protein
MSQICSKHGGSTGTTSVICSECWPKGSKAHHPYVEGEGNRCDHVFVETPYVKAMCGLKQDAHGGKVEEVVVQKRSQEEIIDQLQARLFVSMANEFRLKETLRLMVLDLERAKELLEEIG